MEYFATLEAEKKHIVEAITENGFYKSLKYLRNQVILFKKRKI